MAFDVELIKRNSPPFQYAGLLESTGAGMVINVTDLTVALCAQAALPKLIAATIATQDRTLISTRKFEKSYGSPVTRVTNYFFLGGGAVVLSSTTSPNLIVDLPSYFL